MTSSSLVYLQTLPPNNVTVKDTEGKTSRSYCGTHSISMRQADDWEGCFRWGREGRKRVMWQQEVQHDLLERFGLKLEENRNWYAILGHKIWRSKKRSQRFLYSSLVAKKKKFLKILRSKITWWALCFRALNSQSWAGWRVVGGNPGPDELITTPITRMWGNKHNKI